MQFQLYRYFYKLFIVHTFNNKLHVDEGSIDFTHNLLSVVKKGTLGGGTKIYEGLPVIGPNESQQSRLKLYGLDAINLSLLEL